MKYLAEYYKERRHRKGINKKYNKDCKGLSITNNKLYMKNYRHRTERSKDYNVGVSLVKDYQSKWQKEWRHKKGISKRYREDIVGLSKKIHNQKYKAFLRSGSILDYKIIQMVYEDNIKKYGTLTCYLCLKPIEFGNDHLEHRTPLSRGGTNEYGNLGVAHKSCNSSKRDKTEEEYRIWKGLKC